MRRGKGTTGAIDVKNNNRPMVVFAGGTACTALVLLLVLVVVIMVVEATARGAGGVEEVVVVVLVVVRAVARYIPNGSQWCNDYSHIFVLLVLNRSLIRSQTSSRRCPCVGQV